MEDVRYSIKCNFHNLVNVEILSKHEFPARFFTSEYSYHLSDDDLVNVPKLELRIRLSSQIFPQPGYVFHTHKGLARWSYRIDVSKDIIKIDAFGNRAAIPMIHHMLVHPGLRYLAAFQNVVMLHAGAVSLHDKSLLFTGRGGAGKTTTTSLILSDDSGDWQIHADDYVFIAQGPISLAYLTRSHLYRDLLYWVPDIKHQLTRSERLSLEFFGWLRAWSNDRIKWPVRLSLDRLWLTRDVSFQANPMALIILDRDNVSEPTVESINDQPSVVNDLLDMNFWEARHFLSLIKKSKSITDFNKWVDEWRMQEANLLTQRIQEIPIYKLYLPNNARPSQMIKEKLTEKLKSLVNQEENF